MNDETTNLIIDEELPLADSFFDELDEYDIPTFTTVSSPTYSEFLTALVKADLNFKPLLKTGVNTFFKAKTHSGYMEYSTLDDIGASTKNPLLEQGIVVFYTLIQEEDITYYRCTLVHTSQEFIGSQIPLKFDVNPQKSASLFTYYRRYLITSLLNLSTGEGEDDGNAAAGNSTPDKTDKTDKRKPKAEVIDDGKIAQEEIKRLQQLYTELEIDPVAMKQLLETFKVAKFADLKAEDFDVLVQAMRGLK